MAQASTSVAQPAEFGTALNQYLDGLQDQAFVKLCRDHGANCSPPQVMNAVLRATHGDKRPTSRLYSIFGRIADGLKDYSEVIGQLASAQPLPLAIIWGSVRVVVDGVTRCRDLFELMEAQFDTLATYIEHIREFKSLYGQSAAMQSLFLQSYIDMFRFWHGAYQACNSNGIKRVVKSLTSGPLQSLQRIVADIDKDVTRIRQEAEICLARVTHREHLDARAAREAAIAERDASAEERAAQSVLRTHQMAVNSQTLCVHIRQHLKCASGTDGHNDEFQRTTLESIPDPASCFWLTLDETFVKWSTDMSPQSSILCLEGPSGSGKTVLTSFVVDHLNRSSPPVAAVYYFCQFSQNFTRQVEPFQLIASRLFEIYFSRGHAISESLCNQVLRCTAPEGFKKLIRDLVDSLGTAFFFVDGLDEAAAAPASSYAASVLNFLVQLCRDTDGRVRLWCSFASAIRPLAYYEKIVAACKGERTIDLAKRSEPRIHVAELIRSRLHAFEEELARFQDDDSSDLVSASQNGALSVHDREAIRRAEESLVTEAEGNFLWAHLMTTGLHSDGIRTAEELNRHASRTRVSKRQWLPSSYNEIYTAHFQRRISRNDRDIARQVDIPMHSPKVMALIAYSRRHLCAGELREAAMTLLMKENKNDRRLRERPRPEAFLHCFSVHVLADPGKDGAIDWSSICRLDHASVRDFLLVHPSPWSDSSQFSITPLVIADACLSYIERPVYCTPLQRQETVGGFFTWIDGGGTAMGDRTHHFIQYAIKYWARHLEDPKLKDELTIRARATAFVGSANFQTLLQMQTLWVEGQFCVYSVGGRPSVLRVLPDWLIKSSHRATPQWRDYTVLHHNWARLLNCSDCRDTEDTCSVRPHRGEIDRVWWGSLGPTHSFSKFTARYLSSRLEHPTPNVTIVPGNRFEALAIYNQCVHVLRYVSGGNFLYERWVITDSASAPHLACQQTVLTSAVSTNWALYARGTGCAQTELYGSPTAFSTDGHVLRIGSQLFAMDHGSQTYQALSISASSQRDFPSFIDDVASRGDFIAIGARLHSVANQVLADAADTDTVDAAILRLEMLPGRKRYEVDSDDSSAYDTSSTSSEDRDWEGYESWSEGSTDNDNDIVSDTDSSESFQDSRSLNDGMNSDADSLGSSSDSSSESSSNSSNPESAADVLESDSDDSGPSSPVDPTTMAAFMDLDTDEEEAFYAQQMATRLRRHSSRSHSHSSSPRGSDSGDDRSEATESTGFCITSHQDVAVGSSWMSLTILRRGEACCLTTIFQYRHPAGVMLYDSPPAIHPHKALTVWPLGAGEILFVDFERRSYFVRKLRSSAARTRHLSVKLHFSPCGKYLHIASLEAQLCDITREIHLPSGNTVKAELPAVRLHVFVSTYRLSMAKTTRSPPTLVHRAKANFGTHLVIKVSQLPLTFTWTDDALFITQRKVDLSVHRIPLFKPSDSSRSGVLVPSRSVFLPDNAPHRAVHFVPSTAEDTPAFIVLGSEPHEPTDVSDLLATKTQPGALAPPICCLLNDHDLGEWVTADEKSASMTRDAGNLEHRREKFDPEDDCEVTPYVRFT